MSHTHHDLEVGKFYLTHAASLVYIHERIPKGVTGKAGAIPMPAGLMPACSLECELLKGHKCTHREPLTLAPNSHFTGEAAPMVSYVISQISLQPNRTANQIWEVVTTQTTSRSVGNVIYLNNLGTMKWEDQPAKATNDILEIMANQVWNILRQVPDRSAALHEVATQNHTRANKLFMDLVRKMVTDDVRGASYGSGLVAFNDRKTFLASLTGATSTYQGYTPFRAPELAFLTQMVLKQAQKQYPKDVQAILECYKRVQDAKDHEVKPFAYQEKVVKGVIMRGKRHDKASEVPLPF